jgi:spore germination protein GerM
VYFVKSKGSEMVSESVNRRVPEPPPKTDAQRLRVTMEALLKGPTPHEADAGYFSEIPHDTRLLGVRETAKGNLILDLSGDFSDGGGSNSMLQRLHQVTRTVATVPQKRAVYLYVNGKLVDTLGGEGVMVQEPITQDPSVTQ